MDASRQFNGAGFCRCDVDIGAATPNNSPFQLNFFFNVFLD
jgi:hypothetical protein